MKTLTVRFAFFIVGLLFFLLSCNKNESLQKHGKLELDFLHEVNGQVLVMNDQTFTNAAGNEFRVEKVKYYVSNIELHKTDGSVFRIPDGYYLIEVASLIPVPA